MVLRRPTRRRLRRPATGAFADRPRLRALTGERLACCPSRARHPSGLAGRVLRFRRAAHADLRWLASIGISGAWGTGKSSLIKLVRRSLEERAEGRASQYVFVEFNAWLYQGYDDARAALLEVIATKLSEEAKARETGIDNAQNLLRRVNWLRAAKLGAGSALALALGLPPTGLIGEVFSAGQKIISGSAGESDVAGLEDSAAKAGDAFGGLLNPRPELSPPREIQAIREGFEQTLKEIGITLVVLIDDLDRCLPRLRFQP